MNLQIDRGEGAAGRHHRVDRAAERRVEQGQCRGFAARGQGEHHRCIELVARERKTLEERHRALVDITQTRRDRFAHVHREPRSVLGPGAARELTPGEVAILRETWAAVARDEWPTRLRAIHQAKTISWQKIDGIQFLSITLTGYKLAAGQPDGRGRFAPVSWTAGSFLDEEGKPLSGPPLDWGLAAMFRDINGDGAPDLYVCNDFFFSPDRFWINEGGRRFRAIDPLALRNMSASSMAVDFADIDRDGRDDIFVSDMLDMRRERRMMQFSAIEPNPSAIATTPVRTSGR